MRSRTIKEGSVGLLILVSLGLFGGIILWLSGAQFGRRTYSFIVEFNNANGMKTGSSVVYRGVGVGRITRISTNTNGIEVVIEIAQPTLVIGRDSTIEVNQSGLIGETSVAITPIADLPKEALNLDPLSRNCDTQLIICDGSRITGDVGVSFNQLLRGTQKISTLYTSPEFFENINKLTKNASEAAAGVTKLTRDFSAIAGDIKGFTANANGLTANASRAVVQIGDAATITTAQIGDTAEVYGATGVQLSQLLANVNGLVAENRGSLATTLNDLSQTSSALRATVVELRPALNQFASGQLLQNLETLSANAAEASRDLRDVSRAVTLDSARVTFDNVQKITADLDELTGDPQFRNNLRQLVNGLGNLVSSSDQIQQQIQIAQQLQQITPPNIPNSPANSVSPPVVPTPSIASSPMPTTAPIFSLRSTNAPQLANNYQISPRRELNLPSSLDRTP
jgi:phospholipid/cholesterol/gamma-HCH transport system substrate-binding protein